VFLVKIFGISAIFCILVLTFACGIAGCGGGGSAGGGSDWGESSYTYGSGGGPSPSPTSSPTESPIPLPTEPPNMGKIIVRFDQTGGAEVNLRKEGEQGIFLQAIRNGNEEVTMYVLEGRYRLEVNYLEKWYYDPSPTPTLYFQIQVGEEHVFNVSSAP